MATDILTRLQSEVLVSYAPLHTLLMDWGKDLESHLSEWILDHPDEFQDALAKSYAVGCDFGYTATQASSVFRAKVFGLESRVREFNYESARLAREVTPEGHYVLGNVSATNLDFLEPVGSYTKDYVIEGYTNQIMALAEGGVQAILVAGNQADCLCLAIEIVKKRTNLPAIAHNVYYKGKKGFRTLMGYDPKTASAMVTEAGADVVGCSCGLFSYSDTTELVHQMREGTERILDALPDAGMPGLVDGKTVHPAKPEEMAARAPDWIKAGARLVGGCCGTSLEHYRQLSAKVREINQQKA